MSVIKAFVKIQCLFSIFRKVLIEWESDIILLCQTQRYTKRGKNKSIPVKIRNKEWTLYHCYYLSWSGGGLQHSWRREKKRMV